MTSGGPVGTNGADRQARRLALVAFAAIGLGFAIVNALTELDERGRSGDAVEWWEPWSWELSSFAALLLLAPLVFRAAQTLRPPRFPWSQALPLLALFSLPFSAAHVAIMAALRHFIYAVLGSSYRDFGAIGEVLVYEYRKDLLTYALMLLLPLIAKAMRERGSLEAAAAEQIRIEVRDGSRTVWLAAEDIDWAQSAGNYVELHGRFGTLLHRRTLSALDQQLGEHGFVRIHRSRIVRRALIVSVETRPSGDFDVRLSTGETIGGSRRYRGTLV